MTHFSDFMCKQLLKLKLDYRTAQKEQKKIKESTFYLPQFNSFVLTNLNYR